MTPFWTPMAYKKGPFDVGFGSYDPLWTPFDTGCLGVPPNRGSI